MKTAMILAAGRGERLKPLTNFRPKAMCQVHNIPLIEHHVINLCAAGFTRIIINHAYLGGQIRRHLGNGDAWGVKIVYSPEPPGGLETGGGIYQALSLLGKTAFITVNADIFTNYPLHSLTLPSQSLAHLVLTENPVHNGKGDFGLDDQGLLTNRKDFTFSGIACYHPKAFEGYQPGRYSVVPLLRSLIDKRLITGEFFAGPWIDIGSAERLEEANNQAMRFFD